MTTVNALIVVVAAVVLCGCAVGGCIVLLAVRYANTRDRDESGLGDEDVAAILGYPMYPVWEARQNGGRHDDEGAAR